MIAAASLVATAGFYGFGADGPREEVLRGVSSSHAFRPSEARAWGPIGPVKGPLALAPLSFEEQFGRHGWRVAHLPIAVDDPPGRWAGPGRSPALAQPGLKAVDPDVGYAPGQVCATLMTCLMDLDAWSLAHPGHAPLLVVLDAKTEAPAGEGWQARLRGLAAPAPEPKTPRWDQLALEVEVVLPPERRATTLATGRGKLVLVARGGGGLPPEDAPFAIAETSPDWAVVDLVTHAPGWVDHYASAGRAVIALAPEGTDPVAVLDAAKGATAIVLAPTRARSEAEADAAPDTGS
jgi:hypothetical protein